MQPVKNLPLQRPFKLRVVQVAGMLRAVGRGIDTTDWAWICEGAGQYLFMPPNVSGWDDTRWLDTATFRGRWQMAQYICDPASLNPEKVKDAPFDASKLVARAASLLPWPSRKSAICIKASGCFGSSLSAR